MSAETKPCPECAEAILADAVLCRFCKFDFRVGRRPQAAAAERDLPMEGHLRAISVWYRIFAVLWVAGVLVIMIPALGLSTGSTAGLATSGTVLAVGLGVCVLLYVLGALLARYSNLARIVGGLLSILGIVGTLLNAVLYHPALLVVGLPYASYQTAMAWALFNRRAARICDEEYREVLALTPTLRPNLFGSPFFWIPMIFVCLCFGMAGLVTMGIGSAIAG